MNRKKVLVVGPTPHTSRAIVNDIACSELNLIMVDIADDFLAFLNLLLSKHQDARAIVLMSNTFSRHNVDIQTSVFLLRRCFPSLVIIVIKYEFEGLSGEEMFESSGAFLFTKSVAGNLKCTPDINFLISRKKESLWPAIPTQADVQNFVHKIETNKILNLPDTCIRLLVHLVRARCFVDVDTLALKFNASESAIRTRIGLIRNELEKKKHLLKGVIETVKLGYLFTISPSAK